MDTQSILIIDSEASTFASCLQERIEAIGAWTLIVRDPYPAGGIDILKRLVVSAAVINTRHIAVTKHLDVPILVYGAAKTPADAEALVSQLKWLLVG